MLKPTTKWIPYLIIGLLLTVVSLQRCSINSKSKEISDYQEWNKYYNSQIDSFKNKLNQVVTESKVAQVNSEKEIKELSEQIFDLKKSDERHIKEIQALIRIKQTVRVDTIEIPYTDSFLVDKNDTTLVPRNTVVVPPRNFKDSTKNYQIDGTVLLNKVRINSLILPDTSSLRIVEKKEGFLKKREIVIQGVHTNPLFKTEGMQTVIKRGDKPSRWQKWIKPVIAAIASGFITYKLSHSP